ncbi:AAA family ATPase [Thalassolituus maritimus]|jgi:MSHA biogenesis protein MshM|uniref:MSHA fimbrial biogenesis protein MshM n=1 Tax=Thalassolituus maritimus TaxID=484498 RepID=A0ABP9ZWG8_9GAMM
MNVTEIKQACETHYGLTDTPFSLTPDTGFYVGFPSHDEAFESVQYALSSGEGFIKVTGEVGTGKTLLCRRLLNYLAAEEAETAYIPNPTLSPTALWVAIGAEIGLSGHQRLSELRNDIQNHLLSVAQNGGKLVLVIDEAQCLPPETLEALRLISNLETERQKLIQIVLFGQPELDVILDQQRFRQLRQRITTSAHLEALPSPESVSHYLNQRLVCAGYRGEPLFTRGAVRFLWISSGGTPRLLNVLAAKSLLAAFGQGAKAVHAQHVEQAANDTASVHHPIRWHERLKLVIGL